MDLEQTKRNIDFDIYKGIACWLVIWGHTIQYCYAGEAEFYENLVFRFIYGFHMPFFMVVSGYLFCVSCHKYDLITVIRKQIRHIAYPLIIWNGINFLFKLLYKAGEIHTFTDFFRSVYKSFTGLWFLWSILIISVLVAVVYYKSSTLFSSGIGYVIVFIILIFSPAKIQPCKTMNIWMYPYFLTGFLLSENRDAILQVKLRKGNSVKYLAIILYPVLIHFFHYKDYIYTSGISLLGSDYGIIGQLQINIFRWILGYAGSIFMVVLLQLSFHKPPIKDVLFRLFGKLGQVTLQVYIIQRVLLEEIFGEICKTYISYLGGVNPITKNVYLYNFLLTPMIGLVHLIIIYKLIWWIKKHKKFDRYLFGEVSLYGKET